MGEKLFLHLLIGELLALLLQIVDEVHGSGSLALILPDEFFWQTVPSSSTVGIGLTKLGNVLQIWLLILDELQRLLWLKALILGAKLHVWELLNRISLTVPSTLENCCWILYLLLERAPTFENFLELLRIMIGQMSWLSLLLVARLVILVRLVNLNVFCALLLLSVKLVVVVLDPFTHSLDIDSSPFLGACTDVERHLIGI
jgi:hypothetical protein